MSACSNAGISSKGSEEEEEEDFLPVIPDLLPIASEAVCDAAASQHQEESMRKRSRSPIRDWETDMEGQANVNIELSGERNDTAVSLDTMALLNSEGYPCSALYEKSFCHSEVVHDIGVLTDETGALVVTLDAAGTLRAWRKLPRGVFFMGEYNGLFPRSAERDGTKTASTHYILSDAINSTLILVRVTPRVEDAEGAVAVFVDVRCLNTALITVKGCTTFQFSVQLCEDVTETQSWRERVTPRPFLLHHDYKPFITFFLMQPSNVSGSVLVPCASEKSLHIDTTRRTGDAHHLVPMNLSTANLVVCAQQHRPSGLVALVDESGVIDYARVVELFGDDGQQTIALQIITGAPLPGAADPMNLRAWLTFQRRQKTGFFTLFRESMGASKDGKALLPLSLVFSPSWDHFVITSVLLSESVARTCVHIFEFSSGAFLCRSETEATFMSSLKNQQDVRETLAALRGTVFNPVVVDTVRTAPGGIWVFVPELFEITEQLKELAGGRRVTAFRAMPATGSSVLSCVERLARSVGDMEHHLKVSCTRVENPELPPTSSIGSSNCMRAPLVLVKLNVPASQELKNIVTRSSVGSLLSQEDIKRLFVVQSSRAADTASDEHMLISDDPTFVTTSTDGVSILLYTRYETPIHGVELTRHRSELGSSSNNGVSMTFQLQCKELLLNLHSKRDFSCSELCCPQISAHSPTSQEAVDEGVEVSVDDGTHADKTDSNSDKFSSDVEERRVKNIIAVAVNRVVPWGNVSLSACISVHGFGSIEVCLMPQFAPLATTNFIALSKRGFYDGLTFHRVVAGFMIQGGCPAGDGTGGVSSFGAPFDDEGVTVMDFFSFPTVQWLCMANRGPNTNESQFFVTVGEVAPWLNGRHTVFGFVVSGKYVVLDISRVECDEDSKPRTPVIINNITITGDG
ncbi:putative Cyclophilin type peptidyl prolyl cis trans isomerase [Trypanosoma vivax]|uniref:peptidylprolyl isomerase n=1 Tax=Trypanosoma vivax (strain Y486) TaxID=1055687 RepID=G0U475_TRYVY|nr:putative cyclophilin type peptidyl-prolyl cis-trans isomerase [Trypanosoma vivax]KAH8611586.1 putative Cyclophilin type peptidyl prolyl cis trans isomerase [Trypanosoma vivax]CCC52237.1 putative cyclophilin type peptidyl-prolyl cis-trans isomerase [Trypanosoma vivax Y486]